MKKNLILSLITFGLLQALILPAAASYISLKTITATRVSGQQLVVEISSTNNGDESAFNVQAEIMFAGQKHLLNKTSELPIGGIYQAKLTLPLKVNKPGNYPLVLTMHYADANQYPFSALSCPVFSYQQDVTPPILGQFKPAAFSQAGTLNLTVKNNADQAQQLTIKVVTPKELTALDSQVKLLLPPRSTKNESVRIENFSALPGSNYQIYAIAETEDQNYHYTAVTPGTVKIVANQEILGISYNIIFALLAALILLFLGLQFFKK
ncbi:hypothetical protein A2311_03275 [candidate division WOR-1 bacterium RIFOXYB2_FULL_48_7]|uniref:CARDB domain-containing protein n=1 Tax=candidate division WOR-1 bacterium RIFOXYB2_FULL_48_7 TaxID=1802583 RepID=A0A1F4TJF5_UNCSA|nr:MAG: hypothetical protein A2311_03275 [candidate division WOR-1 bacterium RIFOXYB2_FULL_48_7]